MHFYRILISRNGYDWLISRFLFGKNYIYRYSLSNSCRNSSTIIRVNPSNSRFDWAEQITMYIRKLSEWNNSIHPYKLSSRSGFRSFKYNNRLLNTAGIIVLLGKSLRTSLQTHYRLIEVWATLLFALNHQILSIPQLIYQPSNI